MSPSPEEFEAAAIERVEDAVRSGMPLLVALHAERRWLREVFRRLLEQGDTSRPVKENKN